VGAIMPTRRGDQTSYYDELGVEPDATPAQIRDSFRALVRLLHPDQHLDPELKSIAERQLRRMNGVYAVLSDPEKRRRYDAEFEEHSLVSTKVVKRSSNIDPRRFVSRFLWVGAAIILAGTCLWVYVDNSDSADVVSLDRVAADNRSAGGDAAQIEALRADLRIARFERDTARYELNRVIAILSSRNTPTKRAYSDILPPPPPELTENADSAPDLTPATVLPRSLGPSAVASVAPHAGGAKTMGSDPHQFAGFWFFAPGGERTNKNLYPPQFIEAVLTEHNGVVHGRYRSRYRIVDRAISPDVNFEFSGTPAGPGLVTPWIGSGGARGRVTLSMTGENSLKFDWTAIELGTTQGLASGTATLTRRIE
jgi:curved DNA-binding protein CbpA